ncbi:MAG: amidohydrolase family protein, partial [Actinobacteria bacterium]|nr:amidohydrolase family protein [Actinomycetota bacterium]
MRRSDGFDGFGDFDVFDVHHHVGRAFDALGGELDDGSEESEEFARVELASRLGIMDRGGVRQALVIPGHGYLRPNGLADTRRVNDAIAAYRDRTPERFPVACGIVEPRDGVAAFAEIDRVHDELGIVAISFHTRFQGVSMDSAWILRYLERMGELALVPVIHAMDDTPEESLWKLASIARRVPDLTILALDAFSGFEASRQCFHVVDVAPNVVFDTSLSYNFDVIEDFARRFGAARIVFGTDLYSYPVGRRISHLLPQIVESSLSEDDKRAI